MKWLPSKSSAHRLSRYISRGLVTFTRCVSVWPMAGEAWSIASMLPLTRLVPVYILVQAR